MVLLNSPKSPVTGKNNTTLTDTFLAKDIIRLYKLQLEMDVSRFFKDIDSISLYRCNDTGYKFYYPGGIDGDGKFYEELQNKLGDGYYHSWKFENQLAYDVTKPGDKIIDIGCGPGNFLQKVKKKTGNVFGIELNEKAAAECRKKYIPVYNELIQQHATAYKEYYDVVCMFQVLEHIYDVKSFLDASISVLKTGGKLVIGVPDNEPYFAGYDKYCTLNLPPHHMGLWNKNVFIKLSQLYNLKILKVEYDTTGRILAEAYLRAKYLSGIKSMAGKHSAKEKMIISLFGLLTLPATIIKKVTKGLHGSHIAVVFEKL